MMKERLKEVLRIQSESYKQWRMFAYLVRKIKAMPNVKLTVANGNIYATKITTDGLSAVPCVVAHIDTVHKIVSDLAILEVGDNLTGFNRVTMLQTGIGGDDKVGVFIALECLHTFDNIKAVFFRDEEVGCDGSQIARMEFFYDCSMVIQCDRRGNSEVIDNAAGTQLCSRKFKRAITPIMSKYGYHFADGSITDVMMLKDNGLKVSAVNIACGYYNPHMDNEYVNVSDVENCLAMVKEIIGTYGHTPFPHEMTFGGYFTGRRYYSLSDWFKKGQKEFRWWERNDSNMMCESCGTTHHKDDLEFLPDLNSWVCKRDCLPYFLAVTK